MAWKYFPASLQHRAIDASMIMLQFKMQYALVLISHLADQRLARRKHGQLVDKAQIVYGYRVAIALQCIVMLL